MNNVVSVNYSLEFISVLFKKGFYFLKSLNW